MLVVDDINKIIQIKLGGAVTTHELDWNVSFYVGGNSSSADGTTSGAATVDLCKGGISSDVYPKNFSFRQLGMINVYNKDTVPQTVSIIYKNGSSSRTLMKTVLPVGYTLGYESNEGWYTIDENGARVNVEVSLAGIAIGEAIIGAANDKLLYADATGTLQQITLGTNLSLVGSTLNAASSSQTLAETLVFGKVTGGNDIVLSSGDSIYDESLQSQLTFDPNSITITTLSGTFFTAAGSGAITLGARGIGMDDDMMYLCHEAKLTFDSPIYNYATATASRVAMFDASKNLVGADTATYPSMVEFSYVKGLTSSAQTQITAKAPIASPTFTGVVTLGQDATSGFQAVTYQQLMVAINGADKEAVKYATTGALPAVVYNNGAGTLTGVAFGAISTDGGSPAVGEYILVKDQVSTFQNGWYVVTTTGSGIAVFVLTRRFDSNVSAEFITGTATFVTNGSTLSTTTWAYSGVDNPVLGTDPITFVQTAGQGSFIAGAGITITGTTISIGANAIVNSMINSVAWSKVTATPTTLAGYGITDAISTTLASAKILLGSNTNVATAVNIAKDATIDNVGNLTVSSINSVGITLAGTFQTSGAFTMGLTATAATAVTLPTSGTLYGTKAGSITSAQMLASMSDPTGTGLSVFGTSPTLITPTLGVATATSINGLTITTTTGTLTLTNAKTITWQNSLTVSGTDGEALVLTKGLTVTTNAGTIAFSAASKTLTVNQNLTLDGATGKTMTLTDSVTFNTNSMTFTGGTVMTVGANKNVTFADAFITSGAFSLTLTTTGATNVTLPTSGTLITLTDVYFYLPMQQPNSLSPADATTYYFGAVTNAPTTTATDNDFAVPSTFNFVIVGAVISVGLNTTAGTTENSTLQIRNTTTSASSSIGTFKTNASATVAITTTISGLNIAVSASDSICCQWDTPTWATNPVSCRVFVLLLCKRSS